MAENKRRQQWYLIPRAKLEACPTDPDYCLVGASDVTVMDDHNLDGIVAQDLVAASSAPGTPDADALQLPPGPPMIRLRPQAGNGQGYFSMLHKWAGRSAGGFGRPMAGQLGKGSWGKWSHRCISSVSDDRKLSEESKFYIVEKYNDESTELFGRWLTARNLQGYVTRDDRAPQYHELLNAGAFCTEARVSHYYRVGLDDFEGEWVRAYHGTYFYVLWNVIISGLLGSGFRGEGGDTHISEAGVIYTTPNPDLAYSYACPHQLFGNGFLYKVVLDLRVKKDRMHKSFNTGSYNTEELFFAHDVHVAGMWLFNDTHATGGDSRILEWDPKFETIPQSVVKSWYEQGVNMEITMPDVITDPAPRFMPIDNLSWAGDHVAIQTTQS